MGGWRTNRPRTNRPLVRLLFLLFLPGSLGLHPSFATLQTAGLFDLLQLWNHLVGLSLLEASSKNRSKLKEMQQTGCLDGGE